MKLDVGAVRGGRWAVSGKIAAGRGQRRRGIPQNNFPKGKTFSQSRIRDSIGFGPLCRLAAGVPAVLRAELNLAAMRAVV